MVHAIHVMSSIDHRSYGQECDVLVSVHHASLQVLVMTTPSSLSLSSDKGTGVTCEVASVAATSLRDRRKEVLSCLHPVLMTPVTVLADEP